MSTGMYQRQASKITEIVAAWSKVQQVLRSGDDGRVVPVVIPKGGRGWGWLWMLFFGIYLFGMGIFITVGLLRGMMFFVGGGIMILALAWWWRRSIIEIEQGTTGILSSYGKITGTLAPGRHYLVRPWEKVEFIVDTSTEIPYTAPVTASPTKENVPLKSIEFFIKFRIKDPIAFVRNIGATNFDIVLSSAVQDAIRQRSRLVQTERAFDLRGSDVGDMQSLLNRQMQAYGVQIIGANIPDVQLPDQYQQHLATRERVSKELEAYEKEWELTRKQRIDSLLMEIERTKKERDTKLIEVREAMNKAREDVARIIQERETQAQRVRWDIEARGQSTLKSAENEARALQHLGQSYRDNWAVLQYELALRKLQVAERLVRSAPRPVVIRGEGSDSSALSTLMLSQMLPGLIQKPNGSVDSTLRQLLKQGETQ